MVKNYVYPLVLTSVDAAGIAIDTWTAFDVDGIEEAVFLMRITNDNANDVYISYNGVDRHKFIGAGDSVDMNFQTNSSPSGDVSKVKKGTVLYVQGVASQGDTVYLAGYYNATN